MASTNPHNIMIRTNEEAAARPVYDDLLADAAITPGELVDINATQEIIPHGSANGTADPTMFAVESPYISDPTSAKIDHDYATGENVRYVIPQRGDIVYAFIKASETLVKGVSLLASDGAGALQVIVPDATTVVGTVVAIAWESATIGGARERKKVVIV